MLLGPLAGDRNGTEVVWVELRVKCPTFSESLEMKQSEHQIYVRIFAALQAAGPKHFLSLQVLCE